MIIDIKSLHAEYARKHNIMVCINLHNEIILVAE